MGKGFLSLILNFVTSFATSFSAYQSGKKKDIKSVNAKEKLTSSLLVCMELYKPQFQTLMKIFRLENNNRKLAEIYEVNDLCMKSFANDVILLSEKCINTFIEQSGNPLTSTQISDLFFFFGLLKNFFSITNTIKEDARGTNYSTKTISEYREELMSEIPTVLREECGGLNANFSDFSEKLNILIEKKWDMIKTDILSKNELRRKNK